MKIPGRVSREELSWVLYDVGNSAFVLIMVTTLMPMYFKDVAAAGLANVTSTAYWGYANSVAALTLVLLAPLLGTLSDFQNAKLRLFGTVLLAGLGSTLLLTLAGPGDWLFCIVFYILARVAWAAGNVLYDSLLLDVAARERMDRLSALGYGWGYIGSVIPFVIVMGLIVAMSNPEGELPATPARIGFIIVAVWWGLLSIPLFRHVKQRHFVPAAPNPVKTSFRRLWHTFNNIRSQKPVFLFLLAYFCYIDGVGTVITMATAYGRELEFSVTMLIGVILFIQIIAFPFALLYGRLAERYSAKRVLLAGIGIYSVITVIAFLIPSLEQPAHKVILFWFIAFLVGSSMGGMQALSRSYFGKLIPVESSGEFFGFYNVVGKFAAVLGPLLIGLIGTWTGHSRWGLLSIIVLFILGAWILMQVDDSSTRSGSQQPAGAGGSRQGPC